MHMYISGNLKWKVGYSIMRVDEYNMYAKWKLYIDKEWQIQQGLQLLYKYCTNTYPSIGGGVLSIFLEIRLKGQRELNNTASFSYLSVWHEILRQDEKLLVEEQSVQIKAIKSKLSFVSYINNKK